MAENGTLSTKQQKGIAVLMEERTVRDAAKRVRISERELYRWLQEPAFQQELKRAGQEAIDTRFAVSRH